MLAQPFLSQLAPESFADQLLLPYTAIALSYGDRRDILNWLIGLAVLVKGAQNSIIVVQVETTT